MRLIYIVALNKSYITNKTNVTRLWEVIERELGTDDLYLSYEEDQGDKYFVTVPARRHKIKKICQNAYRNRIYVHVGEDLDKDENHLYIQQDVIGGID